MNTSLETAGVIQSTICRLFSFPVEMETETPCWRKKRRKQVPKLRAAWIISPFFRIDLCQCPTSPFRVEYLLLKKDELGFTACTVVTSTLEFNASSYKIEPPYRRCVCYTGNFSALSNKNCLVS